MVSTEDRLRLAHVGMHPARRLALLDRYPSPGALLGAISSGRVDVPEHARAAARVGAGERRAQLAALGIDVLFKEDDRYPAHLAELPDSPDVLFVRGVLPATAGVAVVGTRRASRYGLRLAYSFGVALAAAGWPAISGLARGVDGAAHQGTLAGGGRGVGVLGCGLDLWYPREHRSLGEGLLADGGGMVSEYPPGTPPLGWRFPPRNRIISGLSSAVVVVEAARQGGALITARAALEQGREVFAVPGDVDRPSSEGCNLLIRDGAIPVLGPEDLIEAVSLLLGPPVKRPDQPGDELVAALGPVGQSIDWLAETLKIPVPEVLVRVARLEAEGKVRREGGVVMAGR